MSDAPTTSTRRRRTSAVLLALTLVTAACGSTDDEPAGTASSASAAPAPVTAAELEGGTFLSEDVQGRALAEGTQVKVAFEDATMAVSAGCNTLFGGYELTDGTLRWSAMPASTRMGCPDELAAQDDWLTTVFAGGVAASTDGDRLVLRGDGATLTLARDAG